MTDDQIKTCDELWREALAAGLVRWMPGMLLRVPGWEPLRIAAEFLPSVWSGICGEQLGHDYAHNIGDDALPVWTDPATVGCLLAMAREATCDPWMHAVLSGPFMGGADWTILGRGSRLVTGGIYAHSEPAALLRAILAAGGER